MGGGLGVGGGSFLQGPLKVSDRGLGGKKRKSQGSGDLYEPFGENSLHRGVISHCGPVTPLTSIKLAGAKLTN